MGPPLPSPTLAACSRAGLCNPELSFELLGVKAIAWSWDEPLVGRTEMKRLIPSQMLGGYKWLPADLCRLKI